MSKAISLDNLQRFKNKWVDPLAERITNLEECIIDSDNLEYDYLSDDVIPTNKSGNPLIESAGMDLTDIKGNSVVYNQLRTSYANREVANLIFTDNNDNTVTVSGQANSTNNYTFLTFQQSSIKGGHKYLISSSYSGNLNVSFLTTTTTFSKETIIDVPSPTQVNINFSAVSGTTYNSTFIVNFIDLTQMFPTNTPTSVDDPRVQWAIQYALANPSYNAGTLLSSKPTALETIGFNIIGENWVDDKFIRDTNGEIMDYSGRYADETYYKVFPNTSYYFYCPETTNQYELWIALYDVNKNFISGTFQGRNRQTIAFGSNVYFIRVACLNKTFHHCANISNANLNGTYRPYVKHSYPLTLPVLRSAGNVQDDISKVKIGTYTFTGNETWTVTETYARTSIPEISNYAKLPATNGVNWNNSLFQLSLEKHTPNQLSSGTYTKGYSINTSGDFCLGIDDYANISNFVGKTIYFELATPTDQPAITLSEDIAIEKGGTLQVSYDNSNQVPADFDFEVAVYKPMQ